MTKGVRKIDEEFFNIKQAAKFLNVSEISLRRWTDSGKLKCLRVGGKRERRFRRDDLLQFLGMDAQSRSLNTQDNEQKISKSNQIMLEGMAIDQGNHLCALYESDIGCLKLSIPFLSDGLRAGDHCYLIAAKSVQKRILKHLNDTGVDVDTYIEDGRLILHAGCNSADEMYEFFEKSFILDSRTGNTSIRVFGDMAWSIEKDIPIEELMKFEMKYNHSLAKSFAVVSLCQYDVRKFNGSAILNALKCHEDTFHYPISRFLSS